MEKLEVPIGTSSLGHGRRRRPPYAFTEHGAVMAANVLNSRRAVQMNVFVIRAFITMRQQLALTPRSSSAWPRSTKRFLSTTQPCTISIKKIAVVALPSARAAPTQNRFSPAPKIPQSRIPLSFLFLDSSFFLSLLLLFNLVMMNNGARSIAGSIRAH
jgi:hypothetical protein